MRQRENERESDREREWERAKVFSGLTIGFMVQCRRNVRIFHCGLCTPPSLPSPPWYLAKGKLLQWVLLCLRVCVCVLHPCCASCACLWFSFSQCVQSEIENKLVPPLRPQPPPPPARTTFIESRKCVFFFLFSLELGNCFLMGASCEFFMQFVKFPVVILCKIVSKNKLLLS